MYTATRLADEGPGSQRSRAKRPSYESADPTLVVDADGRSGNGAGEVDRSGIGILGGVHLTECHPVRSDSRRDRGQESRGLGRVDEVDGQGTGIGIEEPGRRDAAGVQALARPVHILSALDV